MKLGKAAIVLSNAQDVGTRTVQQDYFATSLDEREGSGSLGGVLLVLADGMGGHTDGASASVVAVEEFVRRFPARGGDRSAFADAVRAANRVVLAAGAGSNMGTTLVALSLTHTRVGWASVGDSAIVRVRGGRLRRLNRDHNLGAQLDRDLRAGAITPQQAEDRVEERAFLTSHLGLEELPELDIEDDEAWEPGDTFVLCSDGLTDALDAREIESIVSGASTGDDIADRLVRAALAKARPKQDNVSVLAVSLRSIHARRGRILAGAVGVALLAAGGAIVAFGGRMGLFDDRKAGADAGLRVVNVVAPDAGQPAPDVGPTEAKKPEKTRSKKKNGNKNKARNKKTNEAGQEKRRKADERAKKAGQRPAGSRVKTVLNPDAGAVPDARAKPEPTVTGGPKSRRPEPKPPAISAPPSLRTPGRSGVEP